MDQLLRTLVLIFLAAGLVLHLFHRLGLPSVVGLLLAGAAIGPEGFGVITDPGQISRLADIGILLLMFTIGLEFTPERVRELGRVSGLGIVQMLICIAGTALAAVPWLGSWPRAVFLGFLVAHTSSTLMLRLFMDRGEAGSPAVRVGLGISILRSLDRPGAGPKPMTVLPPP
jgi:CPA2 family monovalent cation:H+ antiporter-2